MKPTGKFHVVDAPAGSGKTYTAIGWAMQQAASDKQKTLFVFKSIELLQQAQRDVCAIDKKFQYGVPINGIHSRMFEQFENDFSVGSTLADHLKQADHRTGEILMITEAAFINLSHWPNRWMWTCICDEIPSIAPSDKLNIPDNHHLLTDFVELREDKEGFSEVRPTQEGKAVLAGYAENPKHDQVSAVLSSMARHIVSPYFETYVRTHQYERVKSNSGEAGSKQLEMFSLLQPSLFGSGKSRQFQERSGQYCEVVDRFKQVILMGAGFQNSLLGMIWPHLDLQFELFEPITKELRYTQHDCGDRLKIGFLFETDWSKSFRGKVCIKGGLENTNLNIFLDTIQSEFHGPCAYLVNKDVEDWVENSLSSIQAEKLPNAPWGLNKYQHIHNVAILSALNPTPAHIGFLTHMGLDGHAIRDALFHSQIYQAVMRCSLRDPASTQLVHVLVPDRKSAEALGGQFDGSQVQKVPLDMQETQQMPIGRPKIAEPKSKQQTLSESRKRKRAMDKEIKRIKAGGDVDDQLLEQFNRECRADNGTFLRLLKVIDENR
ncbi:DEAD/DEAH box helicase family protein [Thalassobius sp. I31.1]|uniref:DEAD/DEAH box helicase family protein n=1 Tax=Thalassobius sp. I31.1 TaxID=2109912 RepID=UPI000D1A3E63|nr:DEAD/DEAH box helicase family protein [Thalassobius sp. I31.1]